MREIKHLSVHQWLRSAIPDSQQPISPIGFLFLKLPPPPCAVLLVPCLTLFCNVFAGFCHVFTRLLSMITMFHHAFGQVFTMVFHHLFQTFPKKPWVFQHFFLHFSNHGHGFFTISPSEAHGFSQHLLAPPLRPRPR